jgi:hypothetical protein
VSHELLHHAEPKLFFDLMHMFELFEFELSSLEKIKRKAFRKSLEKGKATSSPVGPVQPSRAVRARPCRLIGGPHLSAAVLALACSPLPPSAIWAPPVSTSTHCRDRAPVPLSCRPRLSALPTPLTSGPRARHGRAHVRINPGHYPHARPLLKPPPVRSTNSPTRRNLPACLRSCTASSPSSEDRHC